MFGQYRFRNQVKLRLSSKPVLSSGWLTTCAARLVYGLSTRSTGEGGIRHPPAQQRQRHEIVPLQVALHGAAINLALENESFAVVGVNIGTGLFGKAQR